MHFGKVERAVASSLLIALVGATAATASQSSRAAFPGLNGRIVFNDQTRLPRARRIPTAPGVVRLARTRRRRLRDRRLVLAGRTLIAYSKYRGKRRRHLRHRARTGAGSAEITFSRGHDIDPTLSSDGSPDRLRDEPERQRRRLLGRRGRLRRAAGSRALPQNERDPAWSPLGDRIAYTVESGDGRRARSG